MEAKFKIVGIKEHMNALKTLPSKLQASIIRGVLRDAGRVEVKNKTTERLPYGKKKSLKKVLKTVNGKNKTSVLIGVSQDEFLARFFERGTKKKNRKGI